ncbi:MAG TPA: hypothetical protein VFH87_01670 [Candidatus Udaeobacter sp.]|nr:hypothetical protein [Candidatus Udaeobacter sp.]
MTTTLHLIPEEVAQLKSLLEYEAECQDPAPRVIGNLLVKLAEAEREAFLAVHMQDNKAPYLK